MFSGIQLLESMGRLERKRKRSGHLFPWLLLCWAAGQQGQGFSLCHRLLSSSPMAKAVSGFNNFLFFPHTLLSSPEGRTFFHCLLWRGRRGERESERDWERNINLAASSYEPLPGTEPAAWVCTLTGNGTFKPTEPHQPGLASYVFEW